jgi:hypothetical protein
MAGPAAVTSTRVTDAVRAVADADEAWLAIVTASKAAPTTASDLVMNFNGFRLSGIVRQFI